MLQLFIRGVTSRSTISYDNTHSRRRHRGSFAEIYPAARVAECKRGFMMCGRTGLSLNKEQVRCACAYKPKDENIYVKPEWKPEYNDGKEYIPSYNTAPTDVTPVLISDYCSKTSGYPVRALKPMMWGMIPPWHKGNYKGHNLSTNNCRIENIKTSKLYSPVLNNGGRCVIIAEGFYEWQTTVKSKIKQPYYIYMPQNNNEEVQESYNEDKYNELVGWEGRKLLHMAGLYNVWQCENKIIYSYSIVTMESNDTMTWLHHRMPAILDNEEQINAWLDVNNVGVDMALTYLKPIKLLSWHQVSTLVNNSRNKSADCNKRVPTSKGTQKTLTAFFNKSEKRKSDQDQNENSCKKNKQ